MERGPLWSSLCRPAGASHASLGDTVVHLICLHCNRANTSEAKFCTECGASLLRKFCKSCHAANDSSAHFCQACGVALRSASESAAALRSPPPGLREDFVPSLTDVVTLGPAIHLQAPPDLPLTVSAGASAVPLADPQWAIGNAAAQPAIVPPRRAAYPAVAVLAIGVAAVTPIAWWLWPAADKPAARALPKSAAVLAPMAPAVVHSANGRDPSSDAAALAAETAARLLQADSGTLPAVDGKAALARTAAGNGVPVSGAPRVAPRAAASPSALAAARATKPLPGALSPAPARECTPTMETLALCTPTTNSAGR